MASTEPLGDTQGACTICNRRAPAGWKSTRAGAVVLGSGVGAGLVGWLLKQPTVSGALCTWGVGVGGPLLLWGLFKGVRAPASFAHGSMRLDRSVAEPGAELAVSLTLHPDHPLTLRQVVCELRLCEEGSVDDTTQLAGPRVLRTVETVVEGRGPFTRPLAREVRIRIPGDWQATMESPQDARVPRRQVFTEVRTAADFDAHPLFELSQRIVIAAAR